MAPTASSRSERLFAAGAISQQQLEEARSSYQSAAEQLRSLEARATQEAVTLQYYTVRAPAAGVLGDIPVRVGMQATLDTVLTTLNLNQQLEVYVPVPLERASQLRTGLPLQVFDGAGNRLAATTVSFVSPQVDPQTQSILVKGRLPGQGLRSSQFVRARIVWRTVPTLVVPVLAVHQVGDQSFVFVAEPQGGGLVARQRPVRLGPIAANDYAVESGLSPGEQVVVSGTQRVGEGAPIKAL